MKFSSLKTWSRFVIVVFLCCFLVLVQVSVVKLINAQLYCPPEYTPLHDTNDKEHWQQNVTVQVNVNSSPGHFSSTEYNNCIKPVFDNFNTANGVSGNSSKVTFQVTFSTNTVAEITPTGTSRNSPGVVRGFQVNKGNPDPSQGNPN